MFSPEFFGKGSTPWVLGQVVLDQIENKRDENRWGDRVKVRLLGYDPPDGTTLADDDLRYGIILKPTCQGTLNRGSTAIVGGEWVVGFLLDGGNQKNMIIVGVLGRSDPSYEMTGPLAQQKNSSEFLRTLNWFGSIQPVDHHTLSGGKSTNQKPTQPSPAEMGLGPDSEAAAGAEEEAAATGDSDIPDGFVEFTGDTTTTAGGGSAGATTQTAADVLDRDPQSISQYGTAINNTPTVQQLEQLNSSGLTFTPNADGSPGGIVNNPNSLLGG